MNTLIETIAMRNVIALALILFIAAFNAQAQPVAANPSATNVLSITVEGGPAKLINRAFVSVTICAPGSTTDCRTVDHVLLSALSAGLRVLASAITPSLSLPQHTLDNGTPLAECLAFFNGAAWGSVKTADVQLAGELAKSIPIQIIGDPQFSMVPQSCSTAAGQSLNTPETLGGNGILGVGPFLQDCGSGCARTSDFTQWYYGCSASDCQPVSISLDKQLVNPVASFAADNNGVMITLPSVPPAGAATLAGTLTFGIGTQANNTLGTATVLTVSPGNGSFTTVYKGKPYSHSFIDTNAFGIYFFDSEIPLCTSGPNLYCPTSTLALSASLSGANGATKTANFSVANPITLSNQNPDFAVLDGIAASDADHELFYWGLPFFFGRSVFTAIEGKDTPGGTGPYYAF